LRVIVATVFLIILGYSAYQFYLQRAIVRSDVLKLVPAFLVFGLLLLLVSLVSLSDTFSALAPADHPAIHTQAEFETILENAEAEKALLVGVVGAYEDGGDSIAVAFDDGGLTVGIDEDTAVRVPDDIGVLAEGGEVVVKVDLRDVANEETTFVAQEIYAGTRDDYIAFVERAALIPLITAGLSFLGGILTLIVPVVYYFRLPSAAKAAEN
jgi:hypothetical protein